MPDLTVQTDTYIPDDLVIQNSSSRDVLLEEGNTYKRGDLLGLVDRDSVVITPDGANTGDGAFSAVALGSDAEVGVYKITCVETSTNAGVFEIETPTGLEVRADVTVGVAYAGDHLNFTISDGPSDFAVGDTFLVTVSATTAGVYKKSVATAVDGSQHPTAILGEDVDAASAANAVASWAYDEGHFNERQVLFGNGHNAESTRDELRLKNIILRSSNKAFNS